MVSYSSQCLLLQRNLKIMIDMGDSATREKDTRFQQINNEVLDMIKAKVSLMESQVLSLSLSSNLKLLNRHFFHPWLFYFITFLEVSLTFMNSGALSDNGFL